MIAYECLMGGTPFYDDAVATEVGVGGDDQNFGVETSARGGGMKRILYKVLNYEKYLPIPYPGIPVSKEAVLFLRGLLCPSHCRMRYDQIRSHEFFRGIDWTRLRYMQAPFDVPTALPGDTDSKRTMIVLPPYEPVGILKDRNLDFVGYTYNKFAPF
jgi:hypothetical protein